MNPTQEIDSLLNKQEKIQKAVLKDKEQLLLNSTTDSKYDALKSTLGWNDTDKVIDAEVRLNHEYAKVLEYCNTDKVFTEELILDYCLENNYALCRLDRYKGVLAPKLLEDIMNYCKDQGWLITSPENLKQLYLLCRFDDVKDSNSTNPKKSKRYNKYKDHKIIILHKLDSRNLNTQFYKVVSEIGKVDRLRNLMKSVFNTHTRTQNMLNNASLNFIVFLVAMIVFCITLIFGANGSHIMFLEAAKTIVGASTLLLLLKGILPTISTEPTVTHYHDKNYTNLSERDSSANSYLSSWLTSTINTSTVNNRVRRLPIILRIEFGRLLIISAYYFLATVILHLIILGLLSSKGPLGYSTYTENTTFIKEKGLNYKQITKPIKHEKSH